MMPSRFVRFLCWAFGHRMHRIDVDPVMVYPLCVRCGKWTRFVRGEVP